MTIQVTLIPILPENDNYAFLLEAEDGSVAVVDPGDAAPIIKVLEDKGLKPDIILITHHHWDHTDGIDDMLGWHHCKIAGPSKEFGRIPQLDILLDEFSAFKFGGEDVQIIETPGHTSGHICFYFEDSGFVLAGDTLFVMGCGRLLEGTSEQMYDSFQKLIAALPDDTRVYCGHEYTLDNARFSADAMPDNAAIQSRLNDIKTLRANNTPTVPTTVAQEKETNPFMMAKSADEFAQLRALKDKF